MVDRIEGFLEGTIDGKKSRVPARLDLWQSGTGLILGLFMWLHMIFVATILISKDAFNNVVHFLEARFIYDAPVMSYVTSFIVFVVFCIFFIHAGLAMRKLPVNFMQWKSYKAHMNRMKHGETNMWWFQACSGFIMFFLGSAHLIYMFTNANLINADASGARVVNHLMWLVYLILLICVELHGTIGLYRLCLKWGWFEGKDAKESRKKLKVAKWIISIVFLILGILSLAAYIKIGMANL